MLESIFWVWVLFVKRTPLKYNERHISVIFAENDTPIVYQEANLVSLNFFDLVTLYTLSLPPGFQ